MRHPLRVLPTTCPGFIRALVLALVVFAVPTPTEAAVYDLTADWSDSSNPNGPWAYRAGTSNLSLTASTGIDNFPGGQAGWGGLPFWFRSTTIPIANSGFPPDWQIGDVVVHTLEPAGNVTWTSPGPGIVNLSGAVWMGRDIGRSSDWALLRNGVAFTGGHIASGDPYSRAQPFDLAAGWGGSGAVSGVITSLGDTFELRFANGDDYIGVRWTVELLTDCGDGDIDGDEICDDGNVVSGDGCDANCTPTGCGNHVVTGSEECDDGNLTSGDGCDEDCTVSCGNGVVRAGEECDDGNLVSGDGCDENCTTTACGNSVTAGTEECDDGNLISDDGCDENCRVTACRNGIVTTGEDCDDGNSTSGDGCDVNCTLTGCGNGIATNPEECDDGNPDDFDDCSNTCRRPVCGDGTQAGSEQCDDGNPTSGDGCDANCTPTNCGNGVTTAGEECDDGNQTNDDGCTTSCTLPVCGDGYRAGAEICDDGNVVDGDGCSSTCQFEGCSFTGTWWNAGGGILTLVEDEVGSISGITWFTPLATVIPFSGTRAGPVVQLEVGGFAIIFDGSMTDCDHWPYVGTNFPSGSLTRLRSTYCGDGVIQAPETCDDGNWIEADGCGVECGSVIGCGNGVRELDEQCDDGNAVDDDLCSNICRNVGCGDGILQATEQCDDGNVVDGDGCEADCTPSCGNGVIDVEAGETCDPGADDPSDCCGADCRFTPGHRICHPSTGSCDAAERCSGTSSACPADLPRESGEICGVASCPGEPARACDGVSRTCPEAEGQCRIWDLAADWSDHVHPNGPWGYYEESIYDQPQPSGPIPTRAWFPLNGDAFPPGDLARGDQNGFMFKSDALPTFQFGQPDWRVGDVISSSSVDLYWTSPITGRIRISGAIWNARTGTYPTGGEEAPFASEFEGYLSSDTGVDIEIRSNPPPQSDPYVPYPRSAPYKVSSGSNGNPDVDLGDVAVVEGDLLRFEISGSDFDFLGLRLRIELSTCGNGTLDPAELCDDGNLDDGDACKSDCTQPRCGDGVRQNGEPCDDGNTVGGDGCTATCATESGWLCTGREPTRCSLAAACGNGGPPDAGEECDDGNTTSGDGCSATCRREAPSLAGAWQLSVRCGAGSTEEATTAQIEVTQGAANTPLTLAYAGCPTILADGVLHASTACETTPSPWTATVTGNAFTSPPSGLTTADLTVSQPFPSTELGCASPRLVGRVLEPSRLAGVVSDDGFGRAVRIEGTYDRGMVQAFDALDPLGAACGTAPAETCSFTMLRTTLAAGTNVSVEPLDGAVIRFLEVDQPGRTTVVPMSEPAATVPPNFQVLGTPIYYDVRTDAVPAPGIDIDVCLPYPDANDDGFVDGSNPPIDELVLSILHEENGTFVDRTVRRHPTTNQICARVDHFSQFTFGRSSAAEGVLCGATPKAGCRTAGLSSLKSSEGKKDASDAFLWRWTKGQATAQEDFADPSSDAEYAVCTYAGPESALLTGVRVPPGAPAWKSLLTRGYSYKDRTGNRGGIDTIILRTGGAGKASIQVKGKGLRLPDVARPVAVPVTIQLVNRANGACWESTFLPSSIKKNDGSKLQATARGQ